MAFVLKPTEDESELRELIWRFGQENAKFVGKEKQTKAAWFVSNCDTQSHREKFVKKLQQHFQVRREKNELQCLARLMDWPVPICSLPLSGRACDPPVPISRSPLHI